MKTEFLGEWNTEFSHASLHSIIGAIQRRVPLNTTVLSFAQSFGQGVADSEAPSAVGHAVGEEYVLQVTLGQAPNVVHVVVVVLVQNLQQVVGHENSVVIAHDEPPHVLEPQTQRFGDDAGDPNGGAVTQLIGVDEIRGVRRNLHRRQPFLRVDLHAIIQPHHSPHLLLPVPNLYVILPVLPQLRRRRDSEHHVTELRFLVTALPRSGTQRGGGFPLLRDVCVGERGRSEMVDDERRVVAGA